MEHNTFSGAGTPGAATAASAHPSYPESNSGRQKPQGRKDGRAICDELYGLNHDYVGTHCRQYYIADDGTREKSVWWKKPGLNGRAPQDLPLFGAHTLKGGCDMAIVVEGEPARNALLPLADKVGAAFGVKIVVLATVSGAGKGLAPGLKPLSALHHAKTSVLWPDNDEPGKEHMGLVVRGLWELEHPDIRVIRWADAPAKGDAADFVAGGGTADALMALLDGASDLGDYLDKSDLGDKGDQVAGILLADVTPERVAWLSRGRLAVGKITMVDGDPGLGKSTAMIELAARITRGEALPDGEKGRPRGVVIMSAEDGIADTIRPRAEVAGADLRHIRILAEKADGSLPTIPEDIPLIEATLMAMDAALLVVDPLVAFLGWKVNVSRDQDVRRALAPLKAMAERCGVAVVLLRHLNKQLLTNALYRGGGSIGIIGGARFGLMFAYDLEDPPGSRG